MNSVQEPSKQPPLASSPFRYGFEKVFGRMGLVWAVVFTVAATLLRWATDGLLADNAPYSFYYLSVVLTALVGRFGSAIMAVIFGGLCSHFLWVNPRFSLQFENTSQIAQLVVFLLVGCLCALAVWIARVCRLFEDLDKSPH